MGRLHAAWEGLLGSTQNPLPVPPTPPRSKAKRILFRIVAIGAAIATAYAFWFSLQGQISYSMFMFEEAHQQAGAFATWFAQDGKRPDLMVKAADLADTIAAKGSRLNRTWGWMCIAHDPYISYFDDAAPMISEGIRVAADTLSTKTMTATSTGSPLDPSAVFAEQELQGTVRWTDAIQYVGQNVTVLAPITAVTVRDTVAYADTDTDFSFVCWPKPDRPIQNEVYARITELDGTWALIRGKVEIYAATGKPQIKLTAWAQILSTRPLYTN